MSAEQVLAVPALVEHIASAASPNDVALGLRSLSHVTRAALSTPANATVHLSAPVPTTLFTEKWTAPGAMHGLSYDNRIKLLALTAASGEVENLKVALQAVRCAPTTKVMNKAAASGALEAVKYLHQHADCPWAADTTAAAAAAAQLVTVQWLVGAGCPVTHAALEAAAAVGDAAAVEWLLGNTEVVSGLSLRAAADALDGAACAAAAAGHISLFESLFAALVPALEKAPPRPMRVRGRAGQAAAAAAAAPLHGPDGTALAHLLEALAQGADADTLQTFVRTWVDDVEPDPRRHLDEQQRKQVITAAAGSTTPDWQDKVDFLLKREAQLQQAAQQEQQAQQPQQAQPQVAAAQQQAVPRSRWVLNRAMAAPDVASRVSWLLSPERPLQLGICSDDLNTLLKHGQWELAQKLVAEVPGLKFDQGATRAALKGGHMDIVKRLVAEPYNCRLCGPEALKTLAEAGRYEDLVWLVEEFAEKGGQNGETAYTWKVALSSEVFSAAITGGSLELIRWLLKKGWTDELPAETPEWRRKEPRESVEEAWVAAADLGREDVLECLAGEAKTVPFVTDGEPYVRAAKRGDMLTLDCLKRLGCPMPAEALTGALAWGAPLPALHWLVDQGCPVDWPDALAAAQMRQRPPGALEWLQALQRQQPMEAASASAAKSGVSGASSSTPLPWMILGHAGGGARGDSAEQCEVTEGDIEPVSFEDADRTVVVIDNGGKPFTVRISASRGVATMCVTDKSPEEMLDVRMSGTPFKSYRFEKLWIGLDPRERKEEALRKEEEWQVADKAARREGRPVPERDVWYHGGSSVLIGLGSQQYVFVGGMEVYSFSIPGDEIVDFVSTMGNNAVPYPYAVGKENCYLMIEDTYMPWHIIRRTRPVHRVDPYRVLYSNDIVGWLPGRDPAAPMWPPSYRGWQREFALADKKTVHERRW
ncbi:hypothetical protein HYH02_002397 [Chlamydomonas schloesseri]|uniref:Uncharacterized protein n=1 Tax=Chlamydomonas schloesseri TaxID=2026947 RepID=A0A835WTD5_9CHLO|nr:hypothetical protein HYH02_002397 [Chlamydomonas schloesseri]|eukprot:KAG2453064.1 hypothetical protein HYH02_002397 [Chlamydomonas schloesseri]